jgi:hypothetical protein
MIPIDNPSGPPTADNHDPSAATPGIENDPVTIQSSNPGPSSPSPPSLPPWPHAEPANPWRQRAAERLAIMQAAAAGAPIPNYAGNPINIQRCTFGENVGAIESNRIQQEITTPPTTPDSPMTMWPRAPTVLGR